MKPSSGIKVKLRAAQTKVNALNRSILRFGESKPYDLRTDEYRSQQDPSLYHLCFRIEQKKRFPAARWSIIVDEIIYHLRSALDGAVYDLSVGSERPDPTGTAFPITDARSKFDRKLIRYLSDDKKAFIDSVQPYDRPDDLLWILSQMNRRNKHRALRFAAMIVGPDQDPSLPSSLSITITDLDLMRVALPSAKPAEGGAELMRLLYRVTGPNPHVKTAIHSQFDVQFGEQIVSSDSPAGGLLSQMVSRTKSIISTLYSLP
ncbi:MAG: hypothetical protein WEB04_00080 [Dehalococcoidia bacterium]